MSRDGDAGEKASRQRVWYYQSRRRDKQVTSVENKGEFVNSRQDWYGKDAAFTEGKEKQ